MIPLLRTLARVHDAVTACGTFLAKVCLGILVFSYCYEVVARYFFNAPTWWADEAVSYALCLGIFLMMPEVTRAKGHVAVTFLVEMMSLRSAKVAFWIIYLVCFIVCALAFWVALEETLRQIARDVQIMRVKAFPKYWISVFIAYGFGMSALHFLRMLNPRKVEIPQSAQGSLS